jgi:hypothetical protein
VCRSFTCISLVPQSNSYKALVSPASSHSKRTTAHPLFLTTMARRAAEIADARIQAIAKQGAAEARSKKLATPVRRLDNGLLDVFTVPKRYEKG